MAEPNPFDQFDHLRYPSPAPPSARSGSEANPFDQFDHLRFGAPASSFRGIAKQVPVGFNEGVAGVAGAPVDAATGLLNVIPNTINDMVRAVRLPAREYFKQGQEEGPVPTIKNPIGGTSSIKSAMGMVGLNPDDVPANTAGERIARGVGGGIAAAVAPEALVGAAARAIPAVAPAVERAARVFGRTESAGDLAATTAAGAAAGAGGESAAEIAPEKFKPAARALGSIAGALPVAAAPMVAGEAARIAGNFTAPMREAGREGLAGGRLRDAANDPWAVRETLDSAPRELVPGSKPTTFQLTGDPGLGALERQVQTRNPADFAERRAEQNSARVQALQGVQPGGAPEDVSAFLRGRLGEIDRDTQRAVDTATSDAQARAAALGGRGVPEEHGRIMRGALQEAEDSARGNERTLWDAVDPDRKLTVSMQPVLTADRAIYGDMTAAGAAGVTPVEKTIRRVIETYQGVEPFRELSDLRTAVSTAMRYELRTVGRSPAYARLSELRGGVEDAIAHSVDQQIQREAQAVASGQLSPNATTEARLLADVHAWRAKRAEELGASAGAGDPGTVPVGTRRIPPVRRAEVPSRTEFRNAPGNPSLQEASRRTTFDAAAQERLNTATAVTRDRSRTYNQGIVGQILRSRGERSNYVMADAAVPANVFRPGPPGHDAVQSFLRAAGNDPDARGALVDAVASSARRFAQLADGTIDPAKFARWRAMHTDALRAVPRDIASEFGSAASATAAIDTAAQARREAMEGYQKDSIGKLIGVTEPADVVKTIGGIFSRHDAVGGMKRLARETADNPDARDGLRKSIVDFMYGRFVSNTEAATSGVGQIKNDGFQTFIKQNRGALREVFSEGEINMMTAIAADLQRANRSLTAVRIPGQSNTAQDTIAALDRKPEGHGSLLMQAILAGGAGYEVHGVKGAALGLVGAFGKYFTHKLREAGMEKVEDLVKQALLDPETARYLLSRAPPNSSASSAAKMKLAQRMARLSVFEQGGSENAKAH